MEAILKKIPDRYKLVVAAAQRARALNLGVKPLVESRVKNNAIIALQEFADGRFNVDLKNCKSSKNEKSETKETKKEK